VSRQGLPGSSSMSQPLNGERRALAEPATDSEWSEMEGSGREDSRSGRTPGAGAWRAAWGGARSRSHRSFTGLLPKLGQLRRGGRGQLREPSLVGLRERGPPEVGEGLGAASQLRQADGAPASESQLGWEAGAAGPGGEGFLPGYLVNPAHPDVVGECRGTEPGPCAEPAAAEALLHLQQAPPKGPRWSQKGQLRAYQCGNARYCRRSWETTRSWRQRRALGASGRWGEGGGM